MPNGEILSREDRVREAQETLKNLGASRGDSFDIGEFEEDNPQSSDIITSLIANPERLMSSFNLTPSQAENIAAIITGSAAGFGRKHLSKYIGPELAGAVSGFLGGFISKKVVGR